MGESASVARATRNKPRGPRVARVPLVTFGLFLEGHFVAGGVLVLARLPDGQSRAADRDRGPESAVVEQPRTGINKPVRGSRQGAAGPGIDVDSPRGGCIRVHVIAQLVGRTNADRVALHGNRVPEAGPTSMPRPRRRIELLEMGPVLRARGAGVDVGSTVGAPVSRAHDQGVPVRGQAIAEIRPD
jgi:hypothetical protein